MVLRTIKRLHEKRIMTPQQQFDVLNAAPNLSIETRKKRLLQLKNAINTHADEIVDALNQDYGQRSESETRTAEILICLEEIKHTLSHLNNWVKPIVKTAGIKFMFSKNAIIPQPMGVVGIMAPWNYPFNLAIAPMIAAIAAGNKVMIKPSEITPKTADIIAKIVNDVFHENEVAVSLGDVSIAQQFSQLPFKHLLFTGSTAVGKIVMKAAAANLTPVTLELGGKSPVIIDDHYSIKSAAKSIVAGKFYNAGQTCIAPDYVLVKDNQLDQLVEALSTEISQHYPELLNNADYTAIINDQHYQRLNNLAQQSSQFKCVNPQGSNDDQRRIFTPMIVLNPDESSAVMNEEIFGPILPIISVSSIDEAINKVNSKANPLTLYVFSNRKKIINKVIQNTLSGSVAVNETLVQFAQDGIAFGGVGESGMGSYHGKKGFDSFSHLKSVYYQSRLNFNAIVRAPFTPFKKFIIRLLS